MIKRNAVFILSLLLSLPFIVMGLFTPGFLNRLSSIIHAAIISHFGWGYLLSVFFFLVFALYLAFSRYGKLKLGKDYEKPQYSYFGWFSMLFAAGMGIGLIFWGVAEPLSHFSNPPDYLSSDSRRAAKFAMQRSFFHWGLHPWAVYITMSLSIAFFSFRRGMPPLISSCFFPLLGDRIHGWPGYSIDLLAVFATVFGIATSLGLGALQITSGIAVVTPLTESMGLTLSIIGVVTILFMLSSATGLDTGIQILSKANILVAVILLGFMLVVGPTSYILNIFTSTLGEYGSALLTMSLSTNPFLGYDWTKDWTLFYWAWWIAWSPFVGLFVASISRGRTVREFILGALLVPTLLTFIWFAVFGGAAFHLELERGIALSEAVGNNVSTALFELFEHYPLTPLLTTLTLLLLGVFFVTSADSATYVLSMMTSRGNLNPPLSRKIVWGLLQSATAASLIFSGGLEALQKMAIAAALPFAIVMLFLSLSLIRAMRYEWVHERPHEADGEKAMDEGSPADGDSLE
ncbi:MAG: BCCT family transporter [Oceanipulchritudo sp.]